MQDRATGRTVDGQRHSDAARRRQTTQSYTIYAVGRVSRDGQQDFGSEKDVKYENDYSAAVAQAKTLVAKGRRMFLRNIDAEDWSEI